MGRPRGCPSVVANSARFQGSLVGTVNYVTLLMGDKLRAVQTSESPFWEKRFKVFQQEVNEALFSFGF